MNTPPCSPNIAPNPVKAHPMKLMGATALGVGGMMGAGLYSYSKLGATFPGAGGPTNFTRAGFGKGNISAFLNVFQYLAGLIAAALYATGSAEYAHALSQGFLSGWDTKLCAVAVVIVFSLINLLGSKTVGRAELIATGVVVLVLLTFVAAGAPEIQPDNLSLPTENWHGILVATGILYVNYQGFGAVTNASGAMRDPKKELPRALFSSLGIVTVVYLGVSLVTVGLWSTSRIEAHGGHVLANIAQELWRQPGLVLMGISALLASAAAVNAAIYAASRIAADTAKGGALPTMLTQTHRGMPNALLISAGIVSLLVLTFPLAVVGQTASLAFLLLYALIACGHWRVAPKTGASRVLLSLTIGINLVLFGFLFHSAWWHTPLSVYALLIMLAGACVVALYNHARTARHPERLE